MLEFGILLLISALLGIMAARAVFLRRSPPRWTTWDMPGNLIVVVITAIAGFGLIATAIGIAHVVDGTSPWWHGLVAVLLLALIAGGMAGARRLHRRSPLLTET